MSGPFRAPSRGAHLRTCQQPNCSKTFYAKPYEIKNGHAKYCSNACSSLARRSGTYVRCSHCQTSIYKSNSKLALSKSGHYFCCREHKDLAQSLEYGLTSMWPSHFGTASEYNGYRKKAFKHLPHECANCGHNDKSVLLVHHIDHNRENNELTNLLVVCPNCHTKHHKGLLLL